MIDCELEIKNGVAKCINCGLKIQTEQTDPKNIRVNCRKSKRCKHRGEQIGVIEGGCQTCGGNKSDLPIFACELHDECTLSKEYTNTHCCRTCSDLTIGG